VRRVLSNPQEGIEGYPREAFLDDLVNESVDVD
jgi:hypothetical protein